MSHMPKPTFFNLPDDKRQRIIDAAIDEFGARSYGKATLDRIVVKAGISKGSMYQYFAGKSDIYTWLLMSYMGDKKMAYIGSMAPPEGASAWEVLELAFLAGVRFAAAEPRLTVLGARFMRDHHAEPDLDVVATQSRAAGRAWLTGLLIQARDRGELRADVNIGMATTMLHHALGEGMLEHLAQHLGLTLSEFLDQPTATQALTDEDLRGLVSNVIRMFREGAAPSSHEVS
jgi:AcrR family transcriptional regulator